MTALNADHDHATGSLVLVGGAMRDLTILERFLALAGGVEARIVMIPTALAGDHYDESWQGLGQFETVGATNVTVLHTRDRNVANSEEFVQPIREASGVWLTGGRQWRLADAYLHTLAHQEFEALLSRGGVMGGTSAGATILGSYLVRGDTETNTIMMGDHEDGFGFLPNAAIDQHHLRGNRQFDLIEVIEAHPEILGIGLDENTAIVVTDESFEVIGQSYVVIYDFQKLILPEGRFYFLAPGDTYDLKTREATRQSAVDPNPFERVVRGKWPKR